jgi:hypothetical protein
MSVTLVSYPVTTSSGKIRNIFPGFSPVELEFKREDTAIVDVSQGVDYKILISIAGDITSLLNVGEFVYLFSQGTTFLYEGNYKILDLTYSSPNTEVTVDTYFIELSTGGYCNYKQNWYLEAKLVKPANNLITIYPALLQNNGSPSGEVNVNTSMLVDFLKNEIFETSKEIVNCREECKVMYREVWREDDNNSFSLVDQYQIVIIYSAELAEIESFVNGFEIPKIFEGYPFAINLIHSTLNQFGKIIAITFDELDINQTEITGDNPLSDFAVQAFGILQTNFNDNQIAINSSTRYINLNARSLSSVDYLTGDYNDNDYLTINTP